SENRNCGVADTTAYLSEASRTPARMRQRIRERVNRKNSPIESTRGTVLRTNLLFYFSEVLPPAAFELLSKTIDEVTKNSTGGKVTLGILLALWAASGGMTVMISALNGAYGVRESRSWLKVHAIAVGLTIAISILVISAVAPISAL